MTRIIDIYGWNEQWQKVWQEGSYTGLEPGRVIARWRGQWEVASGEGVSLAQLTGKFRKEQPEDAFPEVGDFVGVRNEQGSVLIAALLPRQNVLQRHMAFSVSGRQIIAANIDVAFAAMALDRDFNQRRMERYITAILEGGVKPVALLTKVDLCPTYWAKVYSLTDLFKDLTVLPVCAITGEGMDDVRSCLKPGQSTVIIGSSGVGKSTLLNGLFGSEVMRTGDLRSDGFRGAHTTTNRQMALLPNGALFIDTPGMRELGVVGEGDSLSDSFPDIAELSASCRFRDCGHENEPGCAVRQALAQGRLDPKRLKSWRSISKEMERESAKAEFRLNHLQKNDGKAKKREASFKEREQY
jgi:ribosome biogenesis GTPase / thiamine phosphate phosphatase